MESGLSWIQPVQNLGLLKRLYGFSPKRLYGFFTSSCKDCKNQKMKGKIYVSFSLGSQRQNLLNVSKHVKPL